MNYRHFVFFAISLVHAQHVFAGEGRQPGSAQIPCIGGRINDFMRYKHAYERLMAQERMQRLQKGILPCIMGLVIGASCYTYQHFACSA